MEHDTTNEPWTVLNVLPELVMPPEPIVDPLAGHEPCTSWDDNRESHDKLVSYHTQSSYRAFGLKVVRNNFRQPKNWCQ